MTSKKIQAYIETGYDPNFRDQYYISALWQIALQLALANERLEEVGVHYAAICERNRKMHERYMKMTEPAVRGKKKTDNRKSKIENPKS